MFFFIPYENVISLLEMFGPWELPRDTDRFNSLSHTCLETFTNTLILPTFILKIFKSDIPKIFVRIFLEATYVSFEFCLQVVGESIFADFLDAA
jgi:hypothetical protein